MGDVVAGIVFIALAVFVVDRMSGGAIKEWVRSKWNGK